MSSAIWYQSSCRLTCGTRSIAPLITAQAAPHASPGVAPISVKISRNLTATSSARVACLQGLGGDFFFFLGVFDNRYDVVVVGQHEISALNPDVVPAHGVDEDPIARFDVHGQ